MHKAPSKFEASIDKIKKAFQGPYPLDAHVLPSVVAAESAVYIWFEDLNGRSMGYVGQATSALGRLRQWSREVVNGQFYISYCPMENLNVSERRWITLAGDLNKT